MMAGVYNIDCINWCLALCVTGLAYIVPHFLLSKKFLKSHN